MRFLFIGGPRDGHTEDVPHAGDVYAPIMRPPTFVEPSDFASPLDLDVATYRRRGRGDHVAYCCTDQRQDSIHWVAEGLPDDAFDLRRVAGVPYCWTFRTGEQGERNEHRQQVVHVLGDPVDDGMAVSQHRPAWDYDRLAAAMDQVDQAIARELGYELEYRRLPVCFVDGCTEKAQGGEVNGLWKPRADWRAPWELLGPVRTCPKHWCDLLKMPPTFGDPWGGLAEEQVPAWLRPYLRDNELNAYDRALDHLCTPGREVTVQLRYRHAFTGAWVTAEDYFGLRPPLPTGGKNE